MDCYFCQRNIREIDFKNTELLEKFVSGLGKIRARKRTGVCSKHQRQVAQAIKRARHVGLLSATTKEQR
ncbi:MAG: 30S ribosomal protein S18 [bacterium]|nr:30S ribosomal protein S18 [bacterium]